MGGNFPGGNVPGGNFPRTQHMVRKHYYNFSYSANMLKMRSRGFDRAQYCNVHQI